MPRGQLVRFRVGLLGRDRVVLPVLLVGTAVLCVLVSVAEDWVPLASLIVPLLVGRRCCPQGRTRRWSQPSCSPPSSCCSSRIRCPAGW